MHKLPISEAVIFRIQHFKSENWIIKYNDDEDDDGDDDNDTTLRNRNDISTRSKN
jgi:hypothetical protein